MAVRTAVAPRVDQTWRVPLSDVLVDDEIENAVVNALRSGWWSMGPRVAEFEAGVRDLLRAPGTRSPSRTARPRSTSRCSPPGCGPGDEVLAAFAEFRRSREHDRAHRRDARSSATSMASDDLNLDPDDLEAAISAADAGSRRRCTTAATRATSTRSSELAARHGLAVIEDAAHAPGARGGPHVRDDRRRRLLQLLLEQEPAGRRGRDGRHQRRRRWPSELRLLRSHGMTTLTWDRHRGHASTYDVVVHGFNYRLDELRASIGLVQLGSRRAERGRARTSDRYRAALDGRNGLTMPFRGLADVTPSHHLAVLVLPEGCKRSEFRASLVECQIQTSVHYPRRPPLPRLPGVRVTTGAAANRSRQRQARDPSALPTHVGLSGTRRDRSCGVRGMSTVTAIRAAGRNGVQVPGRPSGSHRSSRSSPPALVVSRCAGRLPSTWIGTRRPCSPPERRLVDRAGKGGRAGGRRRAAAGGRARHLPLGGTSSPCAS